MSKHHSDARRPLIDFIPDNHRDLDVSDEEDGFYTKEEGDFLVHPEWKALVSRTTNRIPRRLQRWLVIFLALLIITYLAWRVHFGPRYDLYMQEYRDMEKVPKKSYGMNMPLRFKDTVHLSDLEEKYLPTKDNDRRLVAVGDVHGCIKELKLLLEKVKFNSERDHLVLTGDIVAKGPDSAGVVALAQELGASCVRGNHEDMLLHSIASHHSFRNPSSDPFELFQLAESQSHGESAQQKLAKTLSKSQIEWLKQRPVILRIGQVPKLGSVLVVHGGLVPGVSLEHQDPYQVMNMRTIDLKTGMPSDTKNHTDWEIFWNHQQKKLPKNERDVVIYGHYAKRGLNIKKYSKGLDSSCVKGGQLTALVLDGKGGERIEQVECKGYV